MASDYQGETIQVFVFFQGKFLGYQCFGQDRLTIGGAPGMDLSLPDCPEGEGYWDVYVSRGALYVWFRGPAGDNGNGGREDPQKIQPLDSFSLGEYRLQVKLLEGQGLVQPSMEAEEDLPEKDLPGDREAASPEEASEPDEPSASREEEGQEASPFVEPGEEEESDEEPVPEPPNEVEGISIDYARSIWRAEEEGTDLSADPADLGTEEDLSRDDEGQAVAGEDREEGSEEERSPEAGEDTEPELVQGISPDYVKDIWGLSEEEETGQQEEEESEADIDGPVTSDEGAPRADTANQWIGFGLQEEDPSEESLHAEEAEEEPQRDEPLGEPFSEEIIGEEEEDLITLGEEEASDEAMEIGSAGDEADAVEPSEDAAVAGSEESGPSDQPGPSADLEERVPLETEPDDQTSVQLPLVAESGGAMEGMSQEERIRFWDDVAKEALANEDQNAGKAEPEETPAEASPPEESPVDAIGDLPSAEEEVLPDREPTPASEPKFASERLESANAAVAIDDAEAEDEEEEESWEEDEEEEDENITYFSLVKEVFPNRTQESKRPYGDRRALEVVRFRGRDIQDIGYLEGGNSYTIRKGWNRSVWKRRGGVPPNFKLARMKNGGSAELHIRESVNGRIYSDAGSQDVWDLRGGKRGRFGLKGQASWLPLPADTWAVLRVNSGRYLVRYVSPRPKAAVQPLRPNVSMGQFKLISLSMLSHILLILVIGLAVPDRTLEGYSRMDQFARIDPNALKALKPPPPPKELKKPKPAAKKEMKKPKPTAASKQRVPKSAQRSPVPTKGKASAGAAKKEVDVAQTGLLAALGGPDAGVLDAKGNSAILLAAVTNLDAVAVPSDTTTFNLAGVAGKLATSEIQVPTSDIIETVGAAQLIKNGDGTLGAMASKGTGEVRAIVHEPPKAKISIRGGMSREAVLKVVNAHLDEVRDCYERELLHNPGISGKILMEWLIQLDGSVRYAKVKFTNIGHSSDLHSCIQAQVVTWNFPRPKGGEEVMVTFPFLFESMGF